MIHPEVGPKLARAAVLDRGKILVSLTTPADVKHPCDQGV